MREIKFRVWCVVDKKMSGMCGNYYAYDPYNDKDKYIWMQYTGLKDKNGVEIYEGDILAFSKTRYIDRGDNEDGLYQKTYGVNTLRINNYNGDIRTYYHLDKEEKEDYITYQDEKIVKGYVVDEYSIVSYDSFGFQPFVSNADSEWGGGHGNDDCIVIGNIYQNPELYNK